MKFLSVYFICAEHWKSSDGYKQMSYSLELEAIIFELWKNTSFGIFSDIMLHKRLDKTDEQTD